MINKLIKTCFYQLINHITMYICLNTSFSELFQVIVYENAPYWRTKDGQPPRDVPICGYRDELCPPKGNAYLTLYMV